MLNFIFPISAEMFIRIMIQNEHSFTLTVSRGCDYSFIFTDNRDTDYFNVRISKSRSQDYQIFTYNFYDVKTRFKSLDVFIDDCIRQFEEFE